MYISDLYEDDLEVSIKVVIVGNGAVGKSSMIQRYCRGIFTQNYKKTIGVDFLEKHLRISGEEVRLMLWDTAGQEEFDAITKAYYRGAQACVVAFSTTDRNSFDAVKKWKKKVEDECGHVPMVLVQNKIDLLHEAQVSTEEVDRLSKELHMRLYRTSVKEDLNVCSVFQHLAENYVHRVRSFTDVYADLSGHNAAPSGFSGIGSRAHQLPLVQIGVGSRPYVTNIGTNNGGIRNGGGGNNNNNNYRNQKQKQQQQQQQQQQMQHKPNGVQMGKKMSSSNNMMLNHHNNMNNKANKFFGSGPHYPPAHQQHGVNLHHPQFHNPAAAGGNGFYSYTSFSPQDYLNNPMFDTLHAHNRSRNRYGWGSSGSGSSGSDRTITLRPLGNLTKKGIITKRMPMINKNSCKVL